MGEEGGTEFWIGILAIIFWIGVIGEITGAYDLFGYLIDVFWVAIGLGLIYLTILFVLSYPTTDTGDRKSYQSNNRVNKNNKSKKKNNTNVTYDHRENNKDLNIGHDVDNYGQLKKE